MLADVIVVGGGPAGLMAAYAAAKSGQAVTLLEKNARPARKLLLTGKGRCNVTNNCGLPELLASITKNARFCHSALSAFTPQDLMALFEQNGLSLKTERGNRVFPQSDRAVDVADTLVKMVRTAGVNIVPAEVKRVVFKCGIRDSELGIADNGAEGAESGMGQNSVAGVEGADGLVWSAPKVVIATGGLSYPKTGSTGDGYRMAAELGHTVTPLIPSLSAVEAHEGWCAKLQGLSLKNINLRVWEKESENVVYSNFGELIFTHFGLSGPLILSASAHMRHFERTSYVLSIDLKPALSEKELDARLLRDFTAAQNRDFINGFSRLLPKTLIPVFVRRSKIEPAQKLNSLTKEQRRTVVELMKNFTLTATAPGPIDEAVVTSGGIEPREINPRTMESKLVTGLFFAGEVIDIDAYTGGFNLQLAFSTGYAAGINN
ncbi:MAG: NAD(P)/FAD-dependent oxidoreductase [Oscillospiraceae bacterium]|jgi:predicted flavoprotein YhiN|nr:NAD(P)/FAD-dependent oxidoreductase [Oscillospiraceae bacterium]